MFKVATYMPLFVGLMLNLEKVLEADEDVLVDVQTIEHEEEQNTLRNITRAKCAALLLSSG